MRKTVNRLTFITLAVLVIDMLVMGVGVVEMGPDLISITAWIEAGCLAVLFPCIVYRTYINGRCPHCGRFRWDHGPYCSHCGKQVK